MDKRTRRRANRSTLEWTSSYLATSKDPVHRELLQILTGGFPVGRPVKEDKRDESSR